MIVLSAGQPPPTVTSLDVMIGAGSQLSIAVALPVLAGKVLSVHWIVMLAGHAITGATLSSTMMVCVHVLVLPQSSVANHVLVMVSSCGHAPPTVTSVEVIVGKTSQLSVAVALPVLAGKVLAVH